MTSKFVFKEAIDSDVSEIVSLLKLCLGDSATRTIDYWNWKHNFNFFGRSYVLLAFDEDKLIGVRSFLRWDWGDSLVKYRCVRAVDTVTHPDYQRMGVFYNLTQKLLDIMLKDKIDFVLNTPNSNSLPANKKMGWRELGKMNLFVMIGSPINFLINRVDKKSFKENEVLKKHSVNISTDERFIFILKQYFLLKSNVIQKVVTPEYFNWRYFLNPVYKYGSYLDLDESFVLFFRIVKRGIVRELRICDLFFIKSSRFKIIDKRIKELIREYHCDLATISVEGNVCLREFIIDSSFISIGARGLNVTLRRINTDIEELMERSKWGWTNGDIEIF